MGDLSVLSPRRDPYRLDTPAMHRDGAWLANEIARLSRQAPCPPQRTALCAGCHRHRAQALSPAVHEHWRRLGVAVGVRGQGGAVARLPPVRRFVDNETMRLRLCAAAAEPRAASIAASISSCPTRKTCASSLRWKASRRANPTGSASAARRPPWPRSCSRWRSLRVEVVLPTGDMSDTLIQGIADRAIADGRRWSCSPSPTSIRPGGTWRSASPASSRHSGICCPNCHRCRSIASP